MYNGDNRLRRSSAAALKKFINTDMTAVYEYYEKIRAEVATWEDISADAVFEVSINDRLLPVVNDSLEKLGKIMPETERVRGRWSIDPLFLGVLDVVSFLPLRTSQYFTSAP